MHGRTTTRAAVLLLLVSLMGLPQARAQAPDTPGREKPRVRNAERRRDYLALTVAWTRWTMATAAMSTTPATI